jgi:GntR family transcriptional regulator
MQPTFPRELQNRFEQAIVKGDLAPGEMVLVADLARRFRAPAGQMGQVLSSAHRKGLVDQAETGTDSFQVLGLASSGFSSVFTHTAESGLKPRSLVRLVQVEAASPKVAEKLRMAVGSPVYRYVRTRYVDEQALANQTNYIPYEICPGLEEDDVSRTSFQKLLEGKYSTITADMVEAYRLVEAGKEDREILGLAERSPVLLVERTALSATGWPLVWANIRIRPDRYQYVAALWPEAADLLAPSSR